MRLSSLFIVLSLSWSSLIAASSNTSSPSTSPALALAPFKLVVEDGSHCVAYRAEKVVFFVSSSEVIGKNCDVAAQVLPEVGGLFNIEVNVPVRSFQSGNSDRDKDVSKLLQIETRPEITFRSKSMSTDEWKALFAKGDFSLSGELMIGSKVHPITLQARYQERSQNAEVKGIAKVRMQDLGIDPPKVAAGILVKARPELELHFSLVSSRILGADSLRLKTEVDQTTTQESETKDQTL